MALNRSPEFTSSNPKPSAAELFGTCGHHLSKLKRTMQSSIPNFKHLSLTRGSETEDFFHTAYVFLCFKPMSPWRKAILDPQTLV